MTTYKEGDRVRLKENKEEGWCEETGMILGVEDQQGMYPRMYVVSLDKAYYVGEDDDGAELAHRPRHQHHP